jgi:hypothetical protein
VDFPHILVAHIIPLQHIIYNSTVYSRPQDSNSAFQFDADPDRASQNEADLDQDPQRFLVYGMVPDIWLSNKTIHSGRWPVSRVFSIWMPVKLNPVYIVVYRNKPS